MAILKMGALVSEIIGSLNGTAFKQQRGTQVMFKKSNGASRSKVLQNKTLGQKAEIFQSWGTLDPAARAEWNFQSTKYKFPNKFGDEVEIPGVQLQRKLQIQLSPYSMATINPNTIDKLLKPFSVTTATIDWGNNSLILNISTAPATIILAVMVEATTRNLNAPIFSRRGIFYCDDVPKNTNIDIFSQLLEKYPFLNDNYNLRLYLYEINPHGFVSAQISADVAVIG